MEKNIIKTRYFVQLKKLIPKKIIKKLNKIIEIPVKLFGFLNFFLKNK